MNISRPVYPIRNIITDSVGLNNLQSGLRNKNVCVIRGGGVLANALCAALAPALREVQFVLVPGKRPQPPRLEAGLTLRRNAIEGLAALMKVSPERVVTLLGGPEACFHTMKIGMIGASGLEKAIEMSVSDGPFGLSTPPYHISDVMLDLMGGLDLGNVHLVSGSIPSSWDSSLGIPIRFDDGKEDRFQVSPHKTIALNASPSPFHHENFPVVRTADKYVVAAQVPIVATEASLFQLKDTFSLGRDGETVAFMTPCADKVPGNHVTDYAVLAEFAETDAIQEPQKIADARRRIGESLLRKLNAWGLSPVDAENTMGTVAIPGSDKRLRGSLSPVCQASVDFGSPYTVVGGDGMYYAIAGALRLAKLLPKQPDLAKNFTAGFLKAYGAAVSDIQGWLDDEHHMSVGVLYHPELEAMLDMLQTEQCTPVRTSLTGTYLGMEILQKVLGD